MNWELLHEQTLVTGMYATTITTFQAPVAGGWMFLTLTRGGGSSSSSTAFVPVPVEAYQALTSEIAHTVTIEGKLKKKKGDKK